MLEIRGFEEFELDIETAERGNSNMVLISLFIRQSRPSYYPFVSIVIKDYPDWSDEFLDYLESDEIYKYPGDLTQLLDELIDSCGVTIIKKGTSEYNEIPKFIDSCFGIEFPDSIICIDYNNHDDPDKKIKCGNHDILIMADNFYKDGILQPIQESPNFSLYNMSYITSEELCTKNNKLFVCADIYSTFHYDVAVPEEETSIKFIRATIGVTSSSRKSTRSNPEKLFQNKQFVTDVDVSWLPYHGRGHLLTIKDIHATE